MKSKTTLIFVLVAIVTASALYGFGVFQGPAVQTSINLVKDDLSKDADPGPRLLKLPHNKPDNLRVLSSVYGDLMAKGLICSWFQAVDKNISGLTDLKPVELEFLVRRICRGEMHILRTKLCPRLAKVQLGQSPWSITYQMAYFLNFLEMENATRIFEKLISDGKNTCANPKFEPMGPHVASRYYQLTGQLELAHECIGKYNYPGAEDWRTLQYLFETASIRLLEGKYPTDFEQAMQTDPLKTSLQSNLIFRIEAKTILAVGELFRGNPTVTRQTLQKILDTGELRDLRMLSERIQYLVDNIDKAPQDWPAPKHFKTWFAKEVLKKYRNQFPLDTTTR